MRSLYIIHQKTSSDSSVMNERTSAVPIPWHLIYITHTLFTWNIRWFMQQWANYKKEFGKLESYTSTVERSQQRGKKKCHWEGVGGRASVGDSCGERKEESCKLYQGEQALTSPTGSYRSSVYSYRFNWMHTPWIFWKLLFLLPQQYLRLAVYNFQGHWNVFTLHT